MPVHSREKKENNHDDMEVDYGENEGSSSEEEESESSSVSEEGDSSGEAGKGLLGAHARTDLPRLGLDGAEGRTQPRPVRLCWCAGAIPRFLRPLWPLSAFPPTPSPSATC